jgi:predicted SAM-dependent methyltransferase
VTGQSDFDAYLEVAEEAQAELRAGAAGDSFLRRLSRGAVPPKWRGRVRIAATNTIRPFATRQARRLQQPILLHLGSGREHKKGWVNVDLVGARVDLAWNVGHRLPFADSSVIGIFHEHLLEHLTLAQGMRLTRECARVLEPGGTLRIGVPDVAALIADYSSGGTQLLAKKPLRPTAMLALQEMFYWHNHQTMYDFDTIDALVRWAGLSPADRFDWGVSKVFLICPDSDARRGETLYVETNKPTANQ